MHFDIRIFRHLHWKTRQSLWCHVFHDHVL